MKKSLTRIPVAVETQMAPTEEFLCHWVMGSPPYRESASVWCLSCPPSLASKEQERRTIKVSEKEKRIVR
jgi:hypothetical protein